MSSVQGRVLDTPSICRCLGHSGTFMTAPQLMLSGDSCCTVAAPPPRGALDMDKGAQQGHQVPQSPMEAKTGPVCSGLCSSHLGVHRGPRGRVSLFPSTSVRGRLPLGEG